MNLILEDIDNLIVETAREFWEKHKGKVAIGAGAALGAGAAYLAASHQGLIDTPELTQKLRGFTDSAPTGISEKAKILKSQIQNQVDASKFRRVAADFKNANK